MSDVTVVICARNAAATIERAVRSAGRQGGPVLVVDDGSSDGTGEIARETGVVGLRVVRPAVHNTLGHARAVGVQAVQTPWLQWLDADDELLPGRAARLSGRAKAEGWDAVWDAAVLRDGPTGAPVRVLPMPAFLQQPNAAVRLFERNHAPGPAWPLVRTAFARRVGYDPGLPTADDLDFMLRGVCAGGRFGFVAECGYRQFAYPASLSRQANQQRTWVGAVLGKHDYADVRDRYRAAGYASRVAAWGLVAMATFRQEWSAALAFLDAACPDRTDDAVLEPEGPWPFRERWRYAFQRGTLRLLEGADDAAAARDLECAESLDPTPETANNLGVAWWRLGHRTDAREALCCAARRLTGYADARANVVAEEPTRITWHPLRRTPSRSDYT